MTIEKIINNKDYEKVVESVRRHFITFVPNLIFFFFLMLIPFGLYFLISNIFPAWLTEPMSYTLLVLLASVYYLSIMLFFYTSFIEFYLDIHIITNDRMVDINQISIFARKIAEVDLYQIQDASSDVKGFFGTIFNYGNVDVQTAGSVPKFSMENAPDPHRLRRVILDLAAEDKKHHRVVNKIK